MRVAASQDMAHRRHQNPYIIAFRYLGIIVVMTLIALYNTDPFWFPLQAFGGLFVVIFGGVHIIEAAKRYAVQYIHEEAEGRR